jgi:hypothetical protein
MTMHIGPLPAARTEGIEPDLLADRCELFSGLRGQRARFVR